MPPLRRSDQHVIIPIQAGSADRCGYCSGENYELLETRGLTGFIPPHGKYKDERPGFHYDPRSDSYTCSQGKVLAFDRLVVDKQGNPKKRYMAKASDCRDCPIKEQCKGKKADEKRLHHSYYKAHYERMVSRLSSRFGKRMMRLRSATVEPVLGSLINYYGLRQINTRSREAAAKVMYVAAISDRRSGLQSEEVPAPYARGPKQNGHRSTCTGSTLFYT
jgi:hypothetical protein